MSDIEFCTKNCSYQEIKVKIKNFLIKCNKYLINPSYISASIYKNILNKNKKEYEIVYSYSVYTNIDNKFSVSENDFSGLRFKNIQLNNVSLKKSHEYLENFFKDISYDLIRKELNTYIKVYRYNNLIIQFYIINDFRNTSWENLFNSEIKKCLDCLKDIRGKFYLELKQNIRVIKDKNIVIVDLIRSRKEIKRILYFDVMMTSKIIFEIKEIANKLNFKTLNHTGDGFIFMYLGEDKNYIYDLYLFLKRIIKFISNFKNSMSEINKLIDFYKIRGVVKKCKIIFEIDNSDYDRKLYFSRYLDNLFNELGSIKFEEEICLKEANVIFLIDDSLLNIAFLKKEFEFCEEKFIVNYNKGINE